MDADNGVVQATAAPRLVERAALTGGLEDFVRQHYRDLIRTAMYMGATREQAKAATAVVLEQLVHAFGRLDEPLGWARRAVITSFIREKQRGLQRVRSRMTDRGAGTPEGGVDPKLTFWEDREWVIQMIKALPPKQAEVVACVVDGFTPAEIAVLLGRSPDAVRQNLREARKQLKQALEQERDVGQLTPVRRERRDR